MNNFEKMVKKGFILLAITITATVTYFVFRATGGNVIPVLVGIPIAVWLRTRMTNVDDQMPSAIEDKTAQIERQKAILKKVGDIIGPLVIVTIFLISSSSGRMFLKKITYKVKKVMEQQMPDAERFNAEKVLERTK